VTQSAWWRRFLVRGVFWRRLLRWAVLNIPLWLEPIVIAFWSLFFLLWGPGRRGVMRNLKAIKPGSWSAMNLLRTYRVFWNYAWTITDNVRFKETHTIPDWELEGQEHFEAMVGGGGAILLTAHMGSYDLGAQLFAEMSHRHIVMVRAPETDPQTREYEERMHAQLGEALRVDFNTNSTDLAFELLEAVQRGKIIAIQGDRVTPGIATYPVTLFGRKTEIPAGPFALAMASRAPIYPVFVMRCGRRRYRLVNGEPIAVVRSGRNRDDDMRTAIDAWTAKLETVISAGWQQWFAFEPFSEELAA